MPAMEPLCNLINSTFSKLSKKELLILEIELFFKLCGELTKILEAQYKDSLQMINSNVKKEKNMIDSNLIHFMVLDLIASGEYSVPGIACYTQSPEDVIWDIVYGHNSNPTFMLARKVMELHRVARREFYQTVVNKLTSIDASLIPQMNQRPIELRCKKA